MTPIFNKLVIIGLGLIGSSIARAAHKAGIAGTIVGVDSNEVSLIYARKNRFIDQVSADAASVVGDADIVIIATPTHLLADICKAIAPTLAKGALVMDTGSVKQVPLAVMSEILPPEVLVVPAHPIAGSEQSGVAAGREDLLEKRRVVITPAAPLTPAQLQKITHFWQALGARVEAMPADLHDTVYGYVSHLPQLLAFAMRSILQPTVAELAEHKNFARFMRISTSDIGLWSGIFLLNRNVMLAAVNRYLDVIIHIRKELASAPESTPSNHSRSACITLFPRIVASCLITTVMEAEKKSGVGFVRFSGTGFSDFISPTTSDPEPDLEHISNHYAQMTEPLAEVENKLVAAVKALENEDISTISSALASTAE